MQIKFLSKASLLIFFAAFLFVAPLNAQDQNANLNRVRTYDVQHYTIRVSFDRAAKKVFGDTTVQFKPLTENFKILELDAAGMSFDSVKLEASGKDAEYRLAGEKIIITLDKFYSPADLIAIRFKYSAIPAKGIYFVDEKRDKNKKVTTPAQVWTQGEPEDAHHWFPSYDFPDDKATTEQFITTEKDETAIGNGELLETNENADGTKTFHFKMPVPHSTYLVSFVVGKYVRVSDSYKNIPLGFYVYPGRESIARPAFGKTKDMMRIFEELTGIAFPFNKYDQTIVANYSSFSAMENITATTYSDNDVFLVQIEDTRNLVEDIVSHELAHSWFGNLVTCRNWAELWLNEGFATFMEAAYREKMYGREDYLRTVRVFALEHLLENMPRGKRHGLFNRLARPDDSLFDSTTYQKGGAVIHTLRETIGDDAFWRGVHIYLARHKFQNVETPDLQKAMEEASGKKLDWFFSQWVYSAGYPEIKVTPTFNRAKKTLTLAVDQTHESDALVPAAFVLPIDVEMAFVTGSKTEKIEITKRNQSFVFNVDGAPKSVVFDKRFKIPLKMIEIKPLKIVNK